MKTMWNMENAYEIYQDTKSQEYSMNTDSI